MPLSSLPSWPPWNLSVQVLWHASVISLASWGALAFLVTSLRFIGLLGWLLGGCSNWCFIPLLLHTGCLLASGMIPLLLWWHGSVVSGK